ncbi:MAG: hypothetical protein QNJ92_10365 [Alphaproteobacteria bacterium]|nr:hypothetical protein [Alphaproteobacteria bacterium]
MYGHYMSHKYAMSGHKDTAPKSHAHSFVEEAAFKRAMARVTPFTRRLARPSI